MLSELSFSAFLQYSPRGESETSARSRRWRDRIKSDAPGTIRKVAERLVHGDEARRAGLMEFLDGESVTLVPVPRSAPLQKGALWPAFRICEELLRQGLGETIQPCLERRVAVPKSAFATRGERPSVQVHADSFGVRPDLLSAGRLLLVDDFVTKGATLLAAASVLHEASVHSEVRGFALVRTMGFVPDVSAVIAPCVGTITLLPDGSADRNP